MYQNINMFRQYPILTSFLVWKSHHNRRCNVRHRPQSRVHIPARVVSVSGVLRHRPFHHSHQPVLQSQLKWSSCLRRLTLKCSGRIGYCRPFAGRGHRKHQLIRRCYSHLARKGDVSETWDDGQARPKADGKYVYVDVYMAYAGAGWE